MTPAKRHAEGLKRFEIAEKAEHEQRKLAIKDLLFINAEDGQWSEDAQAKRKDRPRYTIDRISPALDQLVGDQRQTRTWIKTVPIRDATEDDANVMDGIIRSIQRRSSASNAYDNGFNEQITCGYGGWRILHDYESEDSFDQELLIEMIESAASSLYFDPGAKKYDKSDAKYAFLVSAIPESEFKEKYPKATVTDFSTDTYRNSCWFGTDTVKIAEYWYKIPVKKRLGLLSDGRVIDLEEEAAVLDELLAQGVTVYKERVANASRIEMVLMNGAEILTGPQKWAGKYIPLVPLYGRIATVEGKKFIRGKVRKAIDPQQIYNYATSAAIEATALTPKDPIWITPHQASADPVGLKNFPTKNTPFLFYNPDPVAPGPPGRGGAPQLQTSLLEQVKQAASDIHSTTGIEPASLGNVPQLKSGKAINAETAMGDRGSFMYQDNLRKSLEYTGKILVDMIPRIYDSERIVKIIGPDESVEDITINQTIVDEQTGQPVIVNDLSKGIYSVEAKTGPAHSTKRSETVNQLVSLSSDSPIVQQLALDLIIDNMDLNNGDEIRKRVRKHMIDQGTVEATDEEKKEYGLDKAPPPDPMNEALVSNLAAQTEKLQIEIQKIIAEVHNKDADTQAKIIAAQKDSVAALTSMMGALLDKMNAGMPITDEDIDTLKGQEALVQETQIDVLEGQEIAGSLPMDAKQPVINPDELPEQPPEGFPTGPTGPNPGVDIPEGF